MYMKLVVTDFLWMGTDPFGKRNHPTVFQHESWGKHKGVSREKGARDLKSQIEIREDFVENIFNLSEWCSYAGFKAESWRYNHRVFISFNYGCLQLKLKS